jgi:hypothetical protein
MSNRVFLKINLLKAKPKNLVKQKLQFYERTGHFLFFNF